METTRLDDPREIPSASLRAGSSPAGENAGLQGRRLRGQGPIVETARPGPSCRMLLQRTIFLQHVIGNWQLHDRRFYLANPDFTARHTCFAPDVSQGYSFRAVWQLQGSGAGNLADFFVVFVADNNLLSCGDRHATFR